MAIPKTETLRYEEQGELGTITLLEPFIRMAMVRDLTRICDYLEDESPVKVVVLQGDGDCFSKGIDFGDFKPNEPMDIHGFNKWEKICTRLETLPKATICAMDGEVRGGGVHLALVCDARVATSRTTLQLDEVSLGFLPGMATFRLAKYVGLGHAKRLILQSQQIDAATAASLGIVDTVGDNLAALVQGARDGFGPTHLVAVELGRRLLNECYSTQLEDALGNFLAAQHRAVLQNAFLDTLKAARKPSA
jgi:enoyl-CoA hydratase